MRLVSGWRLALLALLPLAACAGSGGSGGGNSGGGDGGGKNCKNPPPPTVSLSTNIQPLFTASCAVTNACHTGPLPAQQLNLSTGQTYGATVRVPSTEVANQQLVLPGNADKSYLFRKVEGSAGIAGSQMPIGCPGAPQQGTCFSSDEIAALRTWINECAPNN